MNINKDALLCAPELILIHYIQTCLEEIRKDLEENANTPADSYLYMLMHGIGLNRYDFFTQAKQVLTSNEGNPRYLSVDFTYNMQYDRFPTVFLSLGSENESVNNNGIGIDRGYRNYIKDDGEVKAIPVLTRAYDARYELSIISDNSNEVMLLYHIFRAILISYRVPIALHGLFNLRVNGQNLSKNLPEGTPDNIFVRSLIISFQYETSVPEIGYSYFIKDIYGDAKPYEKGK